MATINIAILADIEKALRQQYSSNVVSTVTNYKIVINNITCVIDAIIFIDTDFKILHGTITFNYQNRSYSYYGGYDKIFSCNHIKGPGFVIYLDNIIFNNVRYKIKFDNSFALLKLDDKLLSIPLMPDQVGTIQMINPKISSVFFNFTDTVNLCKLLVVDVNYIYFNYHYRGCVYAITITDEIKIVNIENRQVKYYKSDNIWMELDQDKLIDNITLLPSSSSSSSLSETSKESDTSDAIMEVDEPALTTKSTISVATAVEIKAEFDANCQVHPKRRAQATNLLSNLPVLLTMLQTNMKLNNFNKPHPHVLYIIAKALGIDIDCSLDVLYSKLINFIKLKDM